MIASNVALRADYLHGLSSGRCCKRCFAMTTFAKSTASRDSQYRGVISAEQGDCEV